MNFCCRSFAGSRLASRLLLALLALLASSAWAASNVVDYTRDAAGNITAIRRIFAPGFAITGFSPASGKEGAAVTIYGTGFSTTPPDNIVKFNGVPAAVSASATGSISTTVPTGATTGRITVSVGASTATSPQDFTVIPPTTPTITDFSPGAGVAGTSVSVTGTYFDPAPDATTVKLNGVSGSATVASSTSLTFTIPGGAASGRLTATTAEGTGASNADFIVPPAGVVAADIVTSLRLTAGANPSPFGIGTASKHGLLLFEGTASGYYTLQFASFATSPTNAFVDYKVIKPDNTVLATGRVGNSYRPTIHISRLPATGTYSVLISPGAATLNTNVSVAVDPALAIDGSSVAAATGGANQTLRFVLDMAAGQRLGIGIGGTTYSPANSTGTTFAAYAPDGSSVSSATMPTCYTATAGNTAANCDGEVVATAAGTYSLIASPPNVQTSFSAQLSSDVAGALSADSGQDLTLTRLGQDARYTFTAAAGDSLAVTLSSIATTPQPQTVYLTAVKPDGSFLTSGSGTATAGAYVELGSVPTAGEYAVRVDPGYGANGTMRLNLKQGATLLPTSAPTAFSTSSAGDAARFRFSGTAGQNLTIGLTGVAYGGTSGSSTSVYVYRPDRTQVGSGTTCTPTIASGTCKVTLTNLPTTGTYSIAVIPPGVVTVNGNINVSDDLTGTLTQGSPAVLDASRAGQAARFTFSGTAGESTSVKLHGVSLAPSAGSVGMIAYRPDGAFVGATSASASAPGVLNLPSLPSTGTYKVLLEPTYGVTWQGTLALDAGTLLNVDGSTVSLATTSAGEPLRYRFTATAGQRIEIGLTALAYAAPNSATTAFTLYRPDGTSIASGSCATAGAGSCETAVASAPSSGTYALIFTPPPSSSITAGTLAVSTPATGTFTVGAAAQTVAIARTGQTARYTFSGTSGQLLRLNWSSVTVGSGAAVAVAVLKPDGFSLSSSSFVNGASAGFDIASLPSTGTYTVVFDPSLAATMTADIALVTR